MRPFPGWYMLNFQKNAKALYPTIHIQHMYVVTFADSLQTAPLCSNSQTLHASSVVKNEFNAVLEHLSDSVENCKDMEYKIKPACHVCTMCTLYNEEDNRRRI